MTPWQNLFGAKASRANLTRNAEKKIFFTIYASIDFLTTEIKIYKNFSFLELTARRFRYMNIENDKQKKKQQNVTLQQLEEVGLYRCCFYRCLRKSAGKLSRWDGD